jgi:natural product biosynthesis luciferase-like monooxygenase protein
MMELSRKQGYEIALVTTDTVLTAAELIDKTSKVCSLLKAKAVMPCDKVMVLVSDDLSLLPILWALIRLDICCIPVDPSIGKAGVRELKRRCNAEIVVTERKYEAWFDSEDLIFAREAAPMECEDEKSSDAQKNEVFYMCCDLSDGGQTEMIDAVVMGAIFEDLDRLVAGVQHPSILISRNIPFLRLVIELVWASSRGISVALESLDEKFPAARYLAAGDTHRMKFGLFYFGSYNEYAAGEKYKLLFDTAKFADNNDFNAVWTPERHFNEFGGLYPNPSVLSAALAVSTSNVQIRSGSLVAPLHHPARIAEDWALIDNLSGGRAGISFASGWQYDDFVFFPENYAHRHEHMMSQIDMIKRLWEGEKVAFRNGLGKEIQVAVFPKPIQPKLPVWITVSGRIETFIDAGKIGANILTHLLWQDTGELIEKIAAYRASLRDNGFDPSSGTVTVMVHTYLGEDKEAVRNKVKAPLKNYIRTSTRLIQEMIKTNIENSGSKEVGGRYGTIDGAIPEELMEELTDIAFNRFYEQAGLLGTIDKCQGMLRRLKGYDVDEVACLIDFGLGYDDILKGLTYLQRLKEMHSGNNEPHYPVTITHCSLKELSGCGNPRLVNFLENQQIILTGPESTIGRSSSLPEKVRIVGKDHRISAEAGSVPRFNKALSEEF